MNKLIIPVVAVVLSLTFGIAALMSLNVSSKQGENVLATVDQKVLPTSKPVVPAANIKVPTSRPAAAVKHDLPLYLPPTVEQLTPTPPSEVLAWLTRWQSEELRGLSTDTSSVATLRDLLLQNHVEPKVLADMFLLITMMDGSSASAMLSDHVVVSLKQALSDDEMSKPDKTALIERSFQVHDVLWKSGSVEADISLMEALDPHLAYGSGRSQAIHYQYAELLFINGKTQQAYDAFSSLLNERKVAFEPSLGINRSIDYELGLLLYDLNRFDEAIPHFRAATQLSLHIPESKSAAPILIGTLLKVGNVKEAEAELARYINVHHPAQTEVDAIQEQITSSIATSRQRLKK